MGDGRLLRAYGGQVLVAGGITPYRILAIVVLGTVTGNVLRVGKGHGGHQLGRVLGNSMSTVYTMHRQKKR